MNSIEKQIDSTFRTAFFDMIDETINSESPDYNFITILYKEVKNRILTYIKKDSNTYKSIDQSFDIELFEQMIKNDVFDSSSMIKLVDTTFFWLKQLGAPYRDELLDASKIKILNSEPNKVVSTYLKEVHASLDNLDHDMIEYFKNK